MRIFAAALLLIGVIAPSYSIAQERRAAAVHMGWTESLPSSMPMFGLSFVSYDGYRGFRLGGGVGLARGGSFTVDTARSYIGQWSADADVILAPANIHGVAELLCGLEPELFAGVGLQGAQGFDGAVSMSPVASVGGSIATRIISEFRGKIDTRYRIPMAPGGEGRPTFTNGWDVRFGITYFFGNDNRRRRRPRHIMPDSTYVKGTVCDAHPATSPRSRRSTRATPPASGMQSPHLTASLGRGQS
jgi:hypothetical protein